MKPDAAKGFVRSGFPLIQFDRRPIDPHLITGFVIDWNKELTLVHAIEDQTYHLNGYAILRNPDIRRYRVVVVDDFMAKAATLLKLRPSKPELGIENWQEVFETAGAASPLITIHRERVDKRCCYVGKVIAVSRRSVTIQHVSPRGEWEDREVFPFRDITRVDAVGAYERLLARMAAAMPATGREHG